MPQPETREKILLVDDRPENLLALESVLEDLGHELRRAGSGREALRCLLHEDFALILLDVQMPDIDGFETAALIRARERSRLTPIVFLTAINTGETHVSRGYSLGAVDYVLKPFVPEVLRGKVTSFVELARKTRALQEEIAQRRQAEEQVRRLNEELEQRVARRMAELAAANRELEIEIAERKRAQAEREDLLARERAARLAAEEAQRRVLDADRRKDEFLAMLAHELRNPLAAICSADYILDEMDTRDSRIDRLRAIISRQTHHLSRLVDDLLDLARITRGKIELRSEPVDLAVAVQRAVETVGPLVESRGHDLSVVVPAEPIWLDADLTQLEQIIFNLLNNAAKYTEAGGKIRLTVDREKPARKKGAAWAVLRVRDTGVGMEPEFMPRIFDLFTQADHSLARSQGGMGIGLALVRSLVEMHGGEVSAQSEGPGKGSEFTIRLPIRAGAPPCGARATGDAEVKAPARPSRVLVVEDNVDAAEMLAEILMLWGHEVRVTHDGTAATDDAGAFRPDVVLLDIGLPGMDGYAVARLMRANPALNSVRLVALSGYGQEADRRRAREAGFDMHLTKPVDPPSLRRLLAELTARQSATAALGVGS